MNLLSLDAREASLPGPATAGSAPAATNAAPGTSFALNLEAAMSTTHGAGDGKNLPPAGDGLPILPEKGLTPAGKQPAATDADLLTAAGALSTGTELSEGVSTAAMAGGLQDANDPAMRRPRNAGEVTLTAAEMASDPDVLVDIGLAPMNLLEPTNVPTRLNYAAVPQGSAGAGTLQVPSLTATGLMVDGDTGPEGMTRPSPVITAESLRRSLSGHFHLSAGNGAGGSMTAGEQAPVAELNITVDGVTLANPEPALNSIEAGVSPAILATEGEPTGSQAAAFELPELAEDVGELSVRQSATVRGDAQQTDSGLRGAREQSLEPLAMNRDLAVEQRRDTAMIAATERGAAQAPAPDVELAAPSDRGTDLLNAARGATPHVSQGSVSASGATDTANRPTFTVSTPVGTNGFESEFASRVRWLVGQDMNRAEIRLNPGNLGSIEIQVSTEDEKASVTIFAQNPATREMLEQSLPRLREAFAGSGVTLAEGNVSERESARGDRGGQGSPGGDHGGAGDDVEFGNRDGDAVAHGAPSALGLVDTFI